MSAFLTSFIHLLPHIASIMLGTQTDCALKSPTVTWLMRPSCRRSLNYRD